MSVVERMLSPGEVIETEPEDAGQQGWEANYNIHLICGECKEFPPVLVPEPTSGDIVCGSCGLVLQEHTIDTRSEWRSFNSDDGKPDDKSRVGGPADDLDDGEGLTSEISGADIRGNAHSLLRTQRSITEQSKKTMYLGVLRKLEAFAAASLLPGVVVQTSFALFKEAHAERAFKNKSQESLIAGCLFLASRQKGAVRTFRQIHDATGVTKKELGRIFKSLASFFEKQSSKQKTQIRNGVLMETQAFKSSQFKGSQGLCAGPASQMGLSRPTQALSSQIAERVDNSGILSGRSPLSISGACIFAAAHLMGSPRTAREIAVVVGAGESTIKSVYKDIYKNREDLVDMEWLKKHGSSLDLLPDP